VGGFGSQAELLQLADALEQRPEIDDLALVRAELGDSWFSVTVRDPETLADALTRIEGFEVDARSHPAGVDATVRLVPLDRQRQARTVAELRERARPVSSRPRFRLFHRDEPPTRERGDEPGPMGSAGTTRLLRTSQRSTPPGSREFAGGAAAADSDEPMIPAPASASARPPELLRADARPGGAVTMREHVTIVAHPFRSFVALNEFQEEIRRLRGVINVKVRRFYRGTLHLGVEYEDVIPLAERLRDLQGFQWRLISESDQEVEIMLSEPAAELGSA
jgi:hypothetical protein